MKRAVWVFFILLTASRGIRGAEPLVLNLDEAVRRALERSVNLQKSALDLGLAKYRSDHLWSEIFPSFSLTGGLTLLPATPLVSDPGFSYNENGASYSLSFGVSLGLNAGIASSMKIINLAYRQGLLNYENARRQLEIRITKAFYNLLAGRENISNLEENLDLAERQLEKNRVARANGLASELTWQQSRLSAETARYNLNNARGNYVTALGEFLAELGLDYGDEVVLEGEIDTASLLTVDSEALIREYLPRRPDILAQRQAIERLELTQKQSTGSSRMPSVDLSASWRGGPQNNTGYTGKFTDSLSGSLTLRIPVDPWIPGTRSNQSLKSAALEVEKARLDLENTEAQARSQIRSLVINLGNSWNSLEIARLQEELARRTYELSEEGFRNGAVEFLNYEKTRGDLNDARYRLLQAELSYQNIILDLAAALNLDRVELTRSVP